MMLNSWYLLTCLLNVVIFYPCVCMYCNRKSIEPYQLLTLVRISAVPKHSCSAGLQLPWDWVTWIFYAPAAGAGLQRWREKRRRRRTACADRQSSHLSIYLSIVPFSCSMPSLTHCLSSTSDSQIRCCMPTQRTNTTTRMHTQNHPNTSSFTEKLRQMRDRNTSPDWY